MTPPRTCTSNGPGTGRGAEPGRHYARAPSAPRPPAEFPHGARNARRMSEASAQNELGGLPQRGRVAGHEQRGDERLAPRLEVVADLVGGPDERQALDQLGGDRRGGLVALAA